jgi:BirA family biotin operon repressor/biotin-[acetyl-CoA-carboxylase] ligase
MFLFILATYRVATNLVIKYMLKSKASLLKYNDIINNLPKNIADGIDLHLASTVTSTNDVIQSIPLIDNTKTILCADYQTKARGRRGRSWHNKSGASICMSIRMRANNTIQELYGLNIVIAISIVQAINSIQKTEVQLKWPNDIIMLQRDDYYKIGGVLIELVTTSKTTQDIIIGVGINNTDVGQPSSNTQQAVKIASLQSLYKTAIDRNIIISKLIRYIFSNVDTFFANGLPSFMELWKKFDAFYTKQVSVIAEEKIFIGTALGINNKGGIIVNVNGELQHFYAADVSLRPL